MESRDCYMCWLSRTCMGSWRWTFLCNSRNRCYYVTCSQVIFASILPYRNVAFLITPSAENEAIRFKKQTNNHLWVFQGQLHLKLWAWILRHSAILFCLRTAVILWHCHSFDEDKVYLKLGERKRWKQRREEEAWGQGGKKEEKWGAEKTSGSHFDVTKHCSSQIP